MLRSTDASSASSTVFMFLRFLVTILLVCAVPAFPQGQAMDGVMEGMVASPDRAAIPNAVVRAVNVARAYERQSLADEGGRYRIVLLPPGTYRVTVESPGFTTVQRDGVDLRAGQTLDLNFEVSPATVSTVVEVTGALPAVAVGQVVQSNTYEERVVRNIPTPGRSIQDFYTLHPGVNAPPLSTGGSGTGTSSTVYGGLGLRQINVDGTSNQLQGGARNLVISQDAIAEFQTVMNFSAEFGRVAGGNPKRVHAVRVQRGPWLGLSVCPASGAERAALPAGAGSAGAGFRTV